MILTVEAVIVSHVTGDEVKSNASYCSALRSEHVSRSSSTEQNELEVIVAESAVIASDITVPRRLHETAERTYNSRVGKAPPLEPFVDEGADMLFEEWLPSFERVATWNGWGEAEKLIQLAGHLRGKAL